MKNNYFIEQVLELTKLIPRGRVSTYGAIANYLGTGKSSRLVGWALKNSLHQGDIPAHRVVNRIGMLTGKHGFAYPSQMQELLAEEGIEVVDDKIVDFEKLFWNPQKEL